ncbi:hypothetical protein BDN67DRAFT_1016584 [Paxillus ammoniavirescens]|nr:hypothetical protein BDN67DRAFT_1016584 [Paxillus ammoniavirescens]
MSDASGSGSSYSSAAQEEIKALQDALRTLARKINELESNPPITTERKFSKKFEVVADPGFFKGDRARFSEWWTKIQIWISSNWDGLDTNREPQSEKDWARHQIQNLKQGNSRIDDFITRFLSLSRMANISNKHAVYLLERNTKPEIIKHYFLTTERQVTLDTAYRAICEVGRSFELYEVQFGNQGRGWFNNTPQRNRVEHSSSGGSKTYGGHGEPMDIGAAQKGKCFNCGQDHFVQDCQSPKNPCKECKWLGGRHKKECHSQGKGKGRDV